MNMIRKITLLHIALISVVSVMAALFIAPSTHADISTCNTTYSSRGGGRVDQSAAQQRQQAACEVGYKEGVGDGSVCSRYNDHDLDQACRLGYNTYVSDLSACTGSIQTWNPNSLSSFAALPIHLAQDSGIYTTPGQSSGKTADQCKQELRGTSPSSTTSSNSNSSSSSSSSQSSPDPGAGVSTYPTTFTIKPLHKKDDGGKDEYAEATKCGIDGFFGTIVCGITNFAANITDRCFTILEVFLKTDPITQTDKGGGDSSIYTAWSILRNFANIFFILAFLVIIYSYITNTGLDNYHVKKMIPRLIAGVILINLSFWICALFVDISNVLGKLLIEILPKMVNPSNSGAGGYGTWTEVTGSIMMLGGAAIAGGAAAMYGSFSVLLPTLISAMVAVITTFIILMIRQVLIILFIIISPLAFAAILLPNTSSWFEKWRSYFIPILMLYPAVSFIFGMSNVAATIIREVALQQDSILLTIVSLGISIVPLFLIPSIMKLGGNLLNRYAGVGQGKIAKGLQDKASGYAEHKKRQRDARALSGQKTFNPLGMARQSAVRKRYDRERTRKDIDENLSTARNADFRQQLLAGENTVVLDENGNEVTVRGNSLQQELAQSSNLDDMANARNKVIEAHAKAKAKLVKARRLQDRRNEQTRDERIAAAGGAAGEIAQDAAMLEIAESKDIGAMLQVMKNSTPANTSVAQRREFVKAMLSSGVADDTPMLRNSEALDAFIRGEVDSSNFAEKFAAKSLEQDDWSVSDVAKLDQDLASEFAEVLERSDGSNPKHREFIHNARLAQDANKHSEAAASVGKNKSQLERIAALDRYGGGAP